MQSQFQSPSMKFCGNAAGSDRCSLTAIGVAFTGTGRAGWSQQRPSAHKA